MQKLFPRSFRIKKNTELFRRVSGELKCNNVNTDFAILQEQPRSCRTMQRMLVQIIYLFFFNVCPIIYVVEETLSTQHYITVYSDVSKRRVCSTFSMPTSHLGALFPAEFPVISVPLMGKQCRERHKGLRLKQPELWLQPLCFLSRHNGNLGIFH